MAKVKQQQYIALYDYEARDNEELTIRKNEIITLVEPSGAWLKVRNESKAVGLVPANYLKETVQQPVATHSTRSAAEDPSHVYQQTDLMRTPSLNISAVAKYKYCGNREDELSLEKGDAVIVIEKEADGWWRGRCGNRIGWFPFNYVEEVAVDTAQEKASAETPQSQEKPFVCGVVALYAFNSGNTEELAFQKGDLMDIIDQPSDDPDWWEARKANGVTGLLPRNYVDIVQDAKPVFGGDVSSPQRQTGGGAVSAATPSPRAKPPSFTQEVWYHGRISRKDAETVLNTRAQNGQFIVRESETKPGDYSISMKAPDRIKHFNIKNLADGRYGIGQRKFDSMDELIQHYRRAPIFTTNDAKMFLDTGLPRM